MQVWYETECAPDNVQCEDEEYTCDCLWIPYSLYFLSETTGFHVLGVAFDKVHVHFVGFPFEVKPTVTLFQASLS